MNDNWKECLDISFFISVTFPGTSNCIQTKRITDGDCISVILLAAEWVRSITRMPMSRLQVPTRLPERCLRPSPTTLAHIPKKCTIIAAERRTPNLFEIDFQRNEFYHRLSIGRYYYMLSLRHAEKSKFASSDT